MVFLPFFASLDQDFETLGKGIAKCDFKFGLAVFITGSMQISVNLAVLTLSKVIFWHGFFYHPVVLYFLRLIIMPILMKID